jgi:hypothetical protein
MKRGFKVRPVNVLACALCLLVLLVVGVVLWPQPQGSGLAIRFVGFSNALGQPRSAVFGVTNLSRRMITFFVPEPQVRIGAAWAGVVPGTDPPGLTLDGGLGTNVTVALPKNGDAWRMPIIWAYELSRAEVYLGRGKNLLRTAKEGSLSGWKCGFALTGYTNFSPELELTKAEPDGAANGSQPFSSSTNTTPSAAGSRR